VIDALDLVDLVGERVDLLEHALVEDRAVLGDDRRDHHVRAEPRLCFLVIWMKGGCAAAGR
jgi:hypothetical protein